MHIEIPDDYKGYYVPLTNEQIKSLYDSHKKAGLWDIIKRKFAFCKDCI